MHNNPNGFRRAGFLGIGCCIFVLMAGCASVSYLPPRYEEPILTEDEVATITATGQTGIITIDGKIPVSAADYNEKSLKTAIPPTMVHVLPGSHSLTVGCGVSLETASTIIDVEAGKRYITNCQPIGYTIKFTFELEKEQ